MRFPHPSIRPPLRLLAALLWAGWAPGSGAWNRAAAASWDDFADSAADALTLVSADGDRSLQISGRFDFTVHHLPEAVADLRYTDADEEVLFAPVFRLFGDAILAPRLQAHAQLRADRGFDPADQSLRVRAEEAYLQITPWPGRRAALRVGRFPTLFGSWARRSHAWDYPFVTAPLAQENLTGLWDSDPPPGAATLERWAHVSPVGDAAAIAADEHTRIPVMWGPVYGTGAGLAFGGARWDLAFEVKNTGLSSRPETWDDLDREVWRSPAWAARLGWRPGEPWDLGLSLARGVHLRPEPASVADGYSREDYTQTSLGHDFAYARGHFQFWGELVVSRFELPALGRADTLAYALEAKYRLGPRWAVFTRWSEQFFAPVELDDGGEARWGRDAWRVEGGAVLRLAAHAQVKLQAGLLHERPSAENLVPSAAAQLSLRF